MCGIVTRPSHLEIKRASNAAACFYVFGMNEQDAAERVS